MAAAFQNADQAFAPGATGRPRRRSGIKVTRGILAIFQQLVGGLVGQGDDFLVRWQDPAEADPAASGRRKSMHVDEFHGARVGSTFSQGVAQFAGRCRAWPQAGIRSPGVVAQDAAPFLQHQVKLRVPVRGEFDRRGQAFVRQTDSASPAWRNSAAGVGLLRSRCRKPGLAAYHAPCPAARRRHPNRCSAGRDSARAQDPARGRHAARVQDVVRSDADVAQAAQRALGDFPVRNWGASRVRGRTGASRPGVDG